MTRRHLANYCRHYDVPEPLECVCRAGAVVLKELDPADRRALPCVLSIQKPPAGGGACPYFEPFTEEEIEAHDRETAEALKGTLERIALAEEAKGRGPGVYRDYNCPACGGELVIQVRSSGHTSGACLGCCGVSWIE